jgi:hypothetical protein
MRQFAEVEGLSELVRDAVGGGCRAVAVERLRGGSRKGVYRVRLAGAGPASVIVYSWAEEEDYWPGRPGAASDDVFAPASGLAPFLTARERLDGLGVRVPRVLLADGGRGRCAADAAVVEDVTGGTLEALFDADPARAAGVLGELAGMLAVMHGQRGGRFGRVDVLERGTPPAAPPGEASCEGRVFAGALRDLAEAARRDGRIAAACTELGDRLRELAGRVRPRTEYGLIHGELGPDHVLVDATGHPVLIDIEGLKYFDVEWEHVFLRLRFGKRYAALAQPGLDPRRVDLYTLARRLSLVAGPLRLLDGGFPDRAAMRGIAEHNLKEALALLPRA